jgi:hypothetical protein
VGLFSLNLQQRVTKIEEARREEEIESKRTANLAARFETYIRESPRGPSKTYKFILHNQGPARAEDVSFEIGTPAKGTAPDVVMEGHEFPLSLEPDQVYPILCLVDMETAHSADVDLRWRDGTGPRAKTLRLPVK